MPSASPARSPGIRRRWRPSRGNGGVSGSRLTGRCSHGTCLLRLRSPQAAFLRSSAWVVADAQQKALTDRLWACSIAITSSALSVL